jgi:hypothetical protein
MSHSTIASTTGGSLNELAGQYCVELERLNYGRETINLYLRSIRRLSQLMVSHSLALDQLTPEIAAELLLRTEWHGDRRQYAGRRRVFEVRTPLMQRQRRATLFPVHLRG